MLRVLALAVLIAATFPAGARAGTVTARDASYADELGSGKIHEVTWKAADGEGNALTVTRDGPVLTLVDAAAPLIAGAGCEQVSVGTARCTVPVTHGVDLRATAGDGDDAVTAADVLGKLDGGPGNDRLRVTGRWSVELSGGGDDDLLVSGDGDDTLLGGPGADDLRAGAGSDRLYDSDRLESAPGPAIGPWPDRYDGDPGQDSVSYSTRTTGVVVDLAAGHGGLPGEKDAYASIEGVTGAPGPTASRARRETTGSSAAMATTWWPAAAATTSSTATQAWTRWTAGRAGTSSRPAPFRTWPGCAASVSPAARATTACGRSAARPAGPESTSWTSSPRIGRRRPTASARGSPPAGSGRGRG